MQISYKEVQRLRQIEIENERIRKSLVHHLYPFTDPCKDRGVEWPCDVADALMITTEKTE